MSPTTWILIFAALALLAAGAVVIASRYRPRPTLIAVLRDGQTIRGVLIRRRPGVLEFGGAELLTGDGQKIAADGRVFIYRDNINWLQRPGG